MSTLNAPQTGPIQGREQLNILIPAQIKANLTAISKAQGVSVTYLVRSGIDLILGYYGNLNPMQALGAHMAANAQAAHLDSKFTGPELHAKVQAHGAAVVAAVASQRAHLPTLDAPAPAAVPVPDVVLQVQHSPVPVFTAAAPQAPAPILVMAPTGTVVNRDPNPDSDPQLTDDGIPIAIRPAFAPSLANLGSIGPGKSLTTPPPAAPRGRLMRPAAGDPLDPLMQQLRPMTDRRDHDWYNLQGLMDLLGLKKDLLALVLDLEDDLDRDPNENEVIDTPTIERALRSLKDEAFANPKAIPPLLAWLRARQDAKATA